ncbi:trimeric intracellular cation channel family protein [Mycolicibacterium litorale]|nr:trimeric intracellular cation channel family protein [Mycolicibacterium litorale]MCV7417527.1 trimeric intracellular cation channel family protein [Mycolicibacterium litorale]
MSTPSPLLLALDFAGTFAFALNGALTAVRAERLDIFGVVTLGMFTGLGGGTIRDILLDDLPPATFLDWRYLALAATGGLIAFALSRRLDRLAMPITVLDAVGLSVFAVLSAFKALEMGFGVLQAMIVGTITAVGGGTIRDMMIGRIPTVLRSELYAIPALIGAGCAAAAEAAGQQGTVAALGAAAVCFAIRMVGVRFDLHAPRPPGRPWSDDPPN